MIIITGASDGLGAAVASSAKANNIAVMNISRRPNPHVEENVCADLSTLEGIEAAVAAITAVQHPTALVLNAGVLSLEPLAKITAEEYDRVLHLNLRAPLLMMARLHDWVREHGVDIVVINSLAGRRAYAGQMSYSVSKWGLRGLTENLRLELRDSSARVIGVYPEMLDTNMAAHMPSPMPKSKKPTINSHELAELIIRSLRTPKSMEVQDIIIDRKV